MAACAEECAPLRKRACRKSATCRWGGGAGGCAVATDACDAVQGRRLRKKCAAVSTVRCECSLSPEKKRGKCGKCAQSLVGAPSPDVGAPVQAPPAAPPSPDDAACLPGGTACDIYVQHGGIPCCNECLHFNFPLGVCT